MGDSGVDSISHCRFTWDIVSPFHPWRVDEATFYHGSSAHPTLWKLTLRPLRHELHYKEFSIQLNGEKYGENDCVIATKEIKFVIWLNKRKQKTESLENYHFTPENRHTYEFTAIMHTEHDEHIHRLVIAVNITFPTITNQERSALLYNTLDLKDLSMSMLKLQNNPAHSDLRLVAEILHGRLYFAHSYVLRARWCNFFREHPVEDDNPIETGIFPDILESLLYYVYGGMVRFYEFQTSKLIQLIDKYKWHHLYRVFVQDDSKQERTQSHAHSIHVMDFLLTDHEGRSLELLDGRYSLWHVNPNHRELFEFTLKIRFFVSVGPRFPCFTYLVHPNFPGLPRPVHLRVTLQFISQDDTPGNCNNLFLTLHEVDYVVGSPRPFVSHRSCLSGGNAKLRALLRGGEPKCRHTVRCFATLSSRNKVLQLRVQPDTVVGMDPMVGLKTEPVQGELGRWNVLSDHLSTLLTDDAQKDLRVVCRCDESLTNQDVAFRLHKGIFVERVPEWKKVIKDVVEGDDVPDSVRCEVGSRAFTHILHYIYTGKISCLPSCVVKKVESFAELGNMENLASLCQHGVREM